MVWRGAWGGAVCPRSISQSQKNQRFLNLQFVYGHMYMATQRPSMRPTITYDYFFKNLKSCLFDI